MVKKLDWSTKGKRQGLRKFSFASGETKKAYKKPKAKKVSLNRHMAGHVSTKPRD